MKSTRACLVCGLSLAWATGLTTAAVSPSLPANDETISRLTFCIVKVLDQAPERPPLPRIFGPVELKIRVLRVLHGTATYPGAMLTIRVNVSPYPNVPLMVVSKGDTAIFALESTGIGAELTSGQPQLMPRGFPMCPIADERDQIVLTLQRVFDLCEEQDETRKANRLIQVLESEDTILVGYAINTLSKLAEDPKVKKTACDQFLKNLSHFLGLGRHNVCVAEDALDALSKMARDSALKETIRKELLKARDLETIPAWQRFRVDDTLCRIEPIEYNWSPERIRFLQDMKKRPGSYIPTIEHKLQSAEDLKRVHEHPETESGRTPAAPAAQ